MDGGRRRVFRPQHGTSSSRAGARGVVAVRRVTRRSVMWAAGAVAVAAAAGLAVLIVHAVRDAPRPPVTTTFVVHITDRGTPVGARVLLFAGDEPVHMGRLDVYEMRQGAAACPIAPGVVASWDGLIVAT